MVNSQELIDVDQIIEEEIELYEDVIDFDIEFSEIEFLEYSQCEEDFMVLELVFRRIIRNVYQLKWMKDYVMLE